ncbi:MAG: hypothetical protein H0W02_10365 [Ktedonobacteraceae bacterium]|nr:hypothetical protein [Ktedonobacteraceae bacterium]
MSFTEDELQSFNSILERRLLAHRQEMERAFDQRMTSLLRDLEQRLGAQQQEFMRVLTHKMSEQQNDLNVALSPKLSAQQARITQAVGLEVEQRQQQQQEQLEGMVDRTLATQLLGMEQRLTQHPAPRSLEAVAEGEVEPGDGERFETIEVQTDISWEDLMEVVGKALDDRLSALNESIQAAVGNWEQHLSLQLHEMRALEQVEPYRGDMSSLQGVFHSVERLEQILESMQVAMTANHALLSNRLYHHQQLPLERAHPTGQSAPANGTADGPFSLNGER